MQITVKIVQGTEENKYIAKISTSTGGGQERYKDITAEEFGKVISDMIKQADTSGQIGKK